MRMQNGAATWEDSLVVSHKINRLLPYDPATVSLYYQRELVISHRKPACGCLYDLFTIAKYISIQDVLPVSEWIKCKVYPDNGDIIQH